MPRTRRRKINPPLGLSLRLMPSELMRILTRVTVIRRGRWTCWEWQGHADDNGYGQVKLRGSARWLNRVMYAAFRGRIRHGREIDHVCHNSRCINPWHLRCLPPLDNARDGGRRGQRRVAVACGEEPPF
jgi:hypothetical protein